MKRVCRSPQEAVEIPSGMFKDRASLEDTFFQVSGKHLLQVETGWFHNLSASTPCCQLHFVRSRTSNQHG